MNGINNIVVINFKVFFTFQNMNILITGAAQGIGAEIAKDMSNKENTLILSDLLENKLDAISAQLKPLCKNVVTIAGDLTDESCMTSLKNAISEYDIDVLINNAAYAHKVTSLDQLDKQTMQFSLNVNVVAPFELIEAAIPVMRKKEKGMIINLASRANIYGYTGMGVYAATKAAITSLTGTIALEYPFIKAVTIIPGRTNTPMQANIRGEEEAHKSQSPDYVGDIIAKVVSGDIYTNSGDFVIIDFGEYKVVSELDRVDLHRNMH